MTAPVFLDFVDALGEKAKDFVIRCMETVGVLDSDPLLENWDKLYNMYFSGSICSLERQKSIIMQKIQDMPIYKQEKKQLLHQYQKITNISVDEEAWWAIATADSVAGYRLTLGLKNGGCQYWKDSKDHVGCTNCGYFVGTAHNVEVTPLNLLNQLESVIKQAGPSCYDVIEFLNDGSFLNNDEISHDAKELLLQRVAKLSEVKKVVIESRPEFITEQNIYQVLNCLRDDQVLEIGIGLETCDRFIQQIIINKGYGLDEFEASLKTVNKINLAKDNRVRVFVFTLLKPAYLSEHEAMSDVIKTAIIINDLSKTYNIPTLCTKIEPAVVAKGTLLSTIYNKSSDRKYYKPPSYWTVLEVIATLEVLHAANKVRVATREDMDQFCAIPAATYSNGMVSRVDFVLYNAIQEYVKHRNIIKLLIEVESAFDDQSFLDWKQEIGLKVPNSLKIIELYKDKMIQSKSSLEYNQYVGNIAEIRKMLDGVEYSENFKNKITDFLPNQPNDSLEISSHHLDSLQRVISRRIIELLPKIQLISVNNFSIASSGIQSVRFQIKFSLGERPYTVWAHIPMPSKDCVPNN